MQAMHERLIQAALWPASVWMSLTHFSEHADDDYVERTSPILAFAVAFWIVVGSLAALWFLNGPRVAWQVLWFFLPLVYGVGLWMFAERQGRFPR